MRLIKYINEENKDNPVLEIIKKECSEILNVYEKVGLVLYRGLKDIAYKKEISNNIYKVTPRKDRVPKDTHIFHQEKIDNLFYKKFGWKPRAEGVFATQTKSQTVQYGASGIFLPVNGYKYIWSPKYKDLYSDFFEHLNSKYNPHNFTGNWIEINNKGRKKYAELGYYENYKKHKFIGKLVYGAHLMAEVETTDGKKVKLTYTPNTSEEDFHNSQEKDMEKVVASYKDTGIKELLTMNGYEIMFKCDSYYWIYVGTGRPYNTLEDIGLN